MNISELSEQEKSVILARLCGWEYKHDQITGEWWHEETIVYSEWRHDRDGNFQVYPLSLYSAKNMSLAWRILNWMYVLDKDGKMPNGTILGNYLMWQIEVGFSLEHMPPADAQRAWLDKILEFAIEAGMVENDT